MEYGLHHITSATTTTLIPIHGSGGAIKSISIANQHDTIAAHVDLYLDDGTNTSYIVKSALIYSGTAMVLDHNISFDNSVLGLKLTTVGSGFTYISNHKIMYTREQIKEALEAKGHRYFEESDWNVNIIGVRNSATANKVTNKFDDVITVSYKENDEWQYYEFACTTDPGTHWVENVLNKKGVAILKPGQYRGSHKIRKHQNRYEALGQQKPMTVYRDNNKDGKYDLAKTDTGLFGINIHRATKYAGKKSTQINKWSAGCQVIAANDDWTKFMKIMRKARLIWSNNFTYTLIESKDIT